MKLRNIVGGFCLAMMGFVGCRDVTYNIVKVGSSGEAETPKPFVALNEATYYEKNNGQLVVPVNEDTSGGYDSIPSNYKFRIPTSVVIPAGATLPNGQKIGSMGRLVVSGDARWGDSAVGGGLDLPQKASAWSRYSDDGGKTWSRMQLAVHYDDLDMSTFENTNVRWGVVAGDPTIGRTANNRLIMLTTFAPPAVGLHMNSGNGFTKTGDAYFQKADGCGCDHTNNWCRCEDSTWYLRLRKNTKNYSGLQESLPDLSDMTGVSTPPAADSFSDDDWTVEQYDAAASEYTYYVDVKGGEIKKGSGNGQTGESGTGLYVDADYFVYLDKDYRYPFYVSQLQQDGSAGNDRNVQAGVKINDKKIHCHLFMAMSPYLPWRGCNYIGMSYSDDGGVTWSKNKDITYMVRPKENSSNATGFFFVSPTGGYLHEGLNEDIVGEFGNNNRLLYSAYKGKPNDGGKGQQAVVFWTDDNGETWTHATSGGGSQGAYIGENGTCASETTIVGHPSGALIAIGRGAPPQYAVSTDGGKTWQAKGNLPSSNGKLANSNLVSATRLWLSTSPTGDPLIALTSATQTNPRANGKLYIASIKSDGSNSYTIDPYWNGGAVSVPIADPSNPRFDYSNVRELPDGNLTVLFESNECNDLLLAYVEVQRGE